MESAFDPPVGPPHHGNSYPRGPWRYMPIYALGPQHTSHGGPTTLHHGANGDATPPFFDVHSLLPPGLVPDPREWKRDDVLCWLDWCKNQLSLPATDAEQFHMNGKAMCLLTKQDFRDRAPRAGDVLYNVLHLLLQVVPKFQPAGITAAHHRANKESNGKTNGWEFNPRVTQPLHHMGWKDITGPADAESTGVLSPAPSIESPTERSPERGCNQNGTDSDESPPQPPPKKAHVQQTSNQNSIDLMVVTDNSIDSGELQLQEKFFNVRLLWDFLQQLLNDAHQRYHRCITWKDKSLGIFKIVDPHRLARLWGMQKNHLNMNFDKMSRALRYYYRVKILQKEPGERHCYRFLRHPSELKNCKQRALLTRDEEQMALSTVNATMADTEDALDMSIKEESPSSP